MTLVEDQFAFWEVGDGPARYSDFADLQLRRLGFDLWEVFLFSDDGLLAHDLGRAAQVAQSAIVREQDRHGFADLLSCFNDHVVQLLVL